MQRRGTTVDILSANNSIVPNVAQLLVGRTVYFVAANGKPELDGSFSWFVYTALSILGY